MAILDSTIVVETDSGKEQELTLVNVEIAPAGGGVISAKGEVVYRGERLNIDLVFERSDGKAPDAPLAVRALVKSDLLNATLNGHLTLADHGQVIAENAELSVSDLRRFASWLGTSWPHGPGLGMLTAKGLLTLEEKVVSFDRAEFTLDGNAAMGTMMLKFAGERPSIEGTLAFQSFDLAPYVVSARPSAFSLASNWLSAIEIPGLGSRSFLTQMDADIRLSANNVVNGSVRLGRTAASLSVKNGKLFGDVAELEFDQGGRGEAQFTADATGPEPLYTLRADLSDIDFETAAPYLSTYLIDGSGDVQLELTASGVSETDIARSLAGKISLDLSEGSGRGLGRGRNGSDHVHEIDRQPHGVPRCDQDRDLRSRNRRQQRRRRGLGRPRKQDDGRDRVCRPAGRRSGDWCGNRRRPRLQDHRALFRAADYESRPQQGRRRVSASDRRSGLTRPHSASHVRTDKGWKREACL